MSVYPERARKTLERARALLAGGQAHAAIAELQKVVAKVPKGADAWMLLGRAQSASGAHEQALASFARASRLAPRDPHAWFNQGVACAALARFGEAVQAYARAIETAEGDYPDAVRNIAWCFLQTDQYALAEQALRAYLDDFPATGEVFTLLGMARQGQHDSAGAADAYAQAIALGVRDYTVHLNLSASLHVLQDYWGAVEQADLALQCRRDDPVARYNLATGQFALGQIDLARQTLADVPRSDAQIARLAALSYQDPVNLAQLLDEHLAWGRAAVAACAGASPANAVARAPANGRKLRLGFVSADFREHPVAFFIEGLLSQLDRARFEIHLYFDAPNRDALTARFEQLADGFVELYPLQDPDEAAERIRTDAIDLLFDLGGMTSARIATFARRMAPVQASYLGYACTTGLPTMDYFLTDHRLDPEGHAEAHYCERLLRLGTCFATYTPPAEAPAPASRPMRMKGFPQLASVARLNKISDSTVDAWADALTAVPNARLLVVAQGLQHARTRATLLERLVRRGCAPDRIELRGGLPMSDYLALHADIDLLLDTTPWSGHTTTLHGLWMGVPTVAIECSHHAGRFSAMVMHNAGLPEFVNAGTAGYGQTVRTLLEDAELMERVRAQGRERVRGGVLADHAGLARRFEAACETMWNAACLT